MTIDKDRLKALAEAFPADLEWDSNTVPFSHHPCGDVIGGESDGTYVVYGQPFTVDGDDYEYDGPTYVERCNKEFAQFITEARGGVLALLAENDALRLRVVDESNAAHDAKFDLDRLTEEYGEISDKLRASQKAVMQAAEMLSTITSSDGSGHADLARSVLRIAGIPDSEATAMVDQWVATRPWRNNNGEKK